MTNVPTVHPLPGGGGTNALSVGNAGQAGSPGEGRGNRTEPLAHPYPPSFAHVVSSNTALKGRGHSQAAVLKETEGPRCRRPCERAPGARPAPGARSGKAGSAGVGEVGKQARRAI
ncbi:hypothetical protein NN561_020330 [Cricetulus griseus]